MILARTISDEAKGAAYNINGSIQPDILWLTARFLDNPQISCRNLCYTAVTSILLKGFSNDHD